MFKIKKTELSYLIHDTNSILETNFLPHFKIALIFSVQFLLNICYAYYLYCYHLIKFKNNIILCDVREILS